MNPSPHVRARTALVFAGFLACYLTQEWRSGYGICAGWQRLTQTGAANASSRNRLALLVAEVAEASPKAAWRLCRHQLPFLHFAALEFVTLCLQHKGVPPDIVITAAYAHRPPHTNHNSKPSCAPQDLPGCGILSSAAAGSRCCPGLTERL